MIKTLVSVVSLALTLLAPKAMAATDAAVAEQLSTDDRPAIEFVIREQLMAFRNDDAEAAFAHAAPSVRSKFASAAAFVAAVRARYAAIYRPRSVEFGELVVTDAGPVQSVFLIGPDSLSILASFLMERQSDGEWKIAGCCLEVDGVQAA
jgi:ketosteroid isomerase-like protein